MSTNLGQIHFAKSPNILAVTALAFLFVGNGEDALLWVERLEAVCSSLDHDSETRIAFEGLIPGLRQKALELLGDVDGSVEIGLQLLEGMGSGMGASAQALVHHTLGEAYDLSACPDLALGHYESASILASAGESPTLSAYVQYDLSLHLLRSGETAEAARRCDNALDLCPPSLAVAKGLRNLSALLALEQGGSVDCSIFGGGPADLLSPFHNPDLYLDASAAHARFLVSGGYASDAIKVLVASMAAVKGRRVPRGALVSTACERIELASALGLLSDVGIALGILEQGARGCGAMGEACLRYARACAALAECRFDDALDMCEDVVETYGGSALQRFALRALVLGCCALALRGSAEAAQSRLADAVRVAQRSRAVYPFLPYAAALRPHLLALVSSRKLDYLSQAHAKRILAAANAVGSSKGGVGDDFLGGLLTKKEREVLYLLCLGYSREEIARALTLSVNTVKSHLNRIYAKLGVHSSAEAAAVAHEGGLVVLPKASPKG